MNTQAYPGLGKTYQMFFDDAGKESAAVNPIEGKVYQDLDAIASEGKDVMVLTPGSGTRIEDVKIPSLMPGGWKLTWVDTYGYQDRGRLVLVPGHRRCIGAWLDGQIKRLVKLGYTEKQAQTIMDLRSVKCKDAPEVAQAVLAALDNPLIRWKWAQHWAVSCASTGGNAEGSWRSTHGRHLHPHMPERLECATALILDAIDPLVDRKDK